MKRFSLIFIYTLITLPLLSCSKSMDVSIKYVNNSDIELVFMKNGQPINICINHISISSLNDPKDNNYELVYSKWLPIDSCQKTILYTKNGTLYNSEYGIINTQKHKYIIFSVSATSGENGQTNVYEYDSLQNIYTDTFTRI